jgi:4-hydroxy-tetrahydrodipicolinate synthase
MMRDPKNWEGCFTAVVTPFKENGDLDREAFCRNIELLIKEGLDGIVVSGCTGEHWALTDEEKKELFRLAFDQVKGRITIIGGTSQITADATIRLSRYAKEAGLDGVMILPPALVVPSDREIFQFFETVSNAVDIPILLYNNPRRQVVDMSPELINKLADIANVAAVKESSKDFARVSEVIRAAGHKIRVFSGHSSMQGLPVIVMGAVGWIGSLDTQLIGKDAIELYRLAKDGEIEKAREIQYLCIAAEEDLDKYRSGTFPASLKYAMNLRNRPGGYPRKPILPPTEEQKKHIQSVLQELNLI